MRLVSRVRVLRPHAEAGADIIGPAAVLDGSVAAVRTALNSAGFQNVGVTPSVIFDSALFEAREPKALWS
jgi:porphobilinogen synthase